MRLDSTFYTESDVVMMAKSLLGKKLVTHINGECTAGIIVETEAYRGHDDKGCHANRHGLTPRTATIFGPCGHVYMYICYGMHPMLNIVVGDSGQADAVLVRAIEPVYNIDIMQRRRSMEKLSKSLTNGPGKLAVSLGLSKSQNARCLFDEDSDIWIENAESVEINDIYAGPRVGMSIFVAECSNWAWRFYIKGNPWVSKPSHIEYPW